MATIKVKTLPSYDEDTRVLPSLSLWVLWLSLWREIINEIDDFDGRKWQQIRRSSKSAALINLREERGERCVLPAFQTCQRDQAKVSLRDIDC